MDIIPSANLLRSLRGERIDYGLLIGEGTDNAFDAGAKTLHITVGRDEITFQDDGVGVTRDRIESLFRLGDHGAMATTALGRFGVGIKSQAVNAGDFLEVQSVSSDGRVQAAVNWRQVLRGGWTMPDPRWLPVLAGTPSGTQLTIGDLRKAPAISYDKLRQDLALRFFPALIGGGRIVLNGGEIETLREPDMTDIIDQQIALSDGRSAHLRAGVLVSPGKLNQMHVAYKHRVIMPASSLGCGSYGGLTKMFARLQLDGPWHFAKFKNDLPDEVERDELDEAVEEILQPILEKVSTASISAKLDALQEAVNALVQPEMVPARPRRKRVEKAEPESARERKRRSGNVTHEGERDGPAKMPQPAHDRLLIDFEGVASEHGIGYLQQGKPHRVHLSKDDLYIAELIAERDHRMAARTLYAVAMMIFVQGRFEAQLPPEPFGVHITKLLTLQDDVAAARG